MLGRPAVHFCLSVTMSDITDVARHYITTGITRYADEAVARHPTCCIAKL